MAASAGEPIAFAARDGHLLHGRLFGTGSRGGVLVAPGMAIAQVFYAPIAQALAAQGWRVLTLDLRGIGASRPAGSLRGFAADLQTWAEQDLAGALDELARRVPHGPLHALAHSLGGQLLGLVPGRERLASAVLVAAGSGYWRSNAARTRWRAPLLWHGIAPAALALAGWFPGRRLGLIGDVPHGAMAQWRRWCLHPEYLMGEPRLGSAWRAQYAAWRVPMLGLALADDELLSVPAIAKLLSFYTSADPRFRVLHARDAGLPALGHFGYFRPRSAALWADLYHWFEEHAP